MNKLTKRWCNATVKVDKSNYIYLIKKKENVRKSNNSLRLRSCERGNRILPRLCTKIIILLFQTCNLVLVMVGGVAALQLEIEKTLETHSMNCSSRPEFGRGDNCLVIICDKCDFCQYIGGFWNVILVILKMYVEFYYQDNILYFWYF